ncbi:MAG: preprotein translocase subunit SecG [Dokdonella sp.]
MLTIVALVCYVLVAVAMIVLILLQRGAGAAAGSGFGGGASSTVFGSRGSANFMSRSTAVLAGLFFVLSLGMAIFHPKPGQQPNVNDDLGIMGRAAAPAVPTATTPATGDVPQAGPVPADAGAAVSVPSDASVPTPTGAPTASPAATTTSDANPAAPLPAASEEKKPEKK